jgi:hypothetical protein
MPPAIARTVQVFPSFDLNQLQNRKAVAVPAGRVVRITAQTVTGSWSSGNLDFFRLDGGNRIEITGRTIAAGGGEEVLEESDLQGTSEIEIYLDAVNGSAAYARVVVTVEEPQT